MKKIMVTGAKGYLGRRICQYYKDKYEVIEVSHEDMDITEEGDVMRQMEFIRPDLVIHCAAISNTALCAQKEDWSYRINTLGPEVIAKACEKYGAKMIFCSSDQVYHAEEGLNPHKETEVLHPVNAYAKQKLEAESRCQRACQQVVILRLTWMYDAANKQGSKNEHGDLYQTLINAEKKGESVTFSDQDFRGFTEVNEVVRNMEKVFYLEPGIYNFGSSSKGNAYETVKALAEKWGISSKVVEKNKDVNKKFQRNISMNTRISEKQMIHFS